MTNRPARLLFDECISAPAIKLLKEYATTLSGIDIEIAHLFEKFTPGTPDRDWLEAIASEHWTVVSADRGVTSKAGEKLPMICVELKITHVILGSGLHKRRASFKETAFQRHLSEMAVACNSPLGSRFSLRLVGDATKMLLISTPDPLAIPKVQSKIAFPVDPKRSPPPV